MFLDAIDKSGCSPCRQFKLASVHDDAGIQIVGTHISGTLYEGYIALAQYSARANNHSFISHASLSNVCTSRSDRMIAPSYGTTRILASG